MYFEKIESKAAPRGYVWRVHYCHVTPQGLLERYSKSGFVTKKAAAEYAGARLVELRQRAREPICPWTLDQCFEKYMEENQNRLSPSTVSTYTCIYQRHIAPELGSKSMNAITSARLQEYFDARNHHSASTLDLIRNILRCCFQIVLKAGYLEISPLQQVEARSCGTVRISHGFDQEKLEAMAAYLARKKTHTAYSLCIFLYLGFYLGLRRSEILGLKKEDFDFIEGCVWIRRRLETQGLRTSQYYLTERLKTSSSRACLPMPEKLAGIMKDWFSYHDPDQVVCKADGTFMSVSSIYETLKKAGKACGFDFHPHLLRHGYVSELVTSGVDVKTAAALARHKNVRTTLEIYTHISSKDQKRAISAVFDH